MEKIADIVAEMRAKTAKSKDEAWYDKRKWERLCNRIEMATMRQRIVDLESGYKDGYADAKEEGKVDIEKKGSGIKVVNFAKVFEALKKIKELSYEYFCEALGKTDPEVYLDKCGELANTALSAPPRNCDLMANAKEAITAIHNDREYVQSPIDERELTVEWLFKEAVGASNEQPTEQCGDCQDWERDGKSCVGTCPHQEGMSAEWASGCPHFSKENEKRG